ncbi:MAG: SurA N-terminal domain-containing protein [Anaerolineae bacterium]
MAKKRVRQSEEEAQRQSRKEVLLARKQAQQTRQIRLAAAGVIALLVLVFVVAVVNELILIPNRAVAMVEGEEISLKAWQERVQYERAQRIIVLENQLEAFGGDVGIVQQFGGQLITELQDSESLAQTTLEQMINEVAIRHAAEERGITVTSADVDAEIGSSFNYFGGDSPTPVPTSTATPMPTPSLTPIPTPVITEVVPTAAPFPTPTIGPPATPLPTATPVSAEAFQQQLDDLMTRLQDLAVSAETFRSVVKARIYRDRLMDALAEENNLSDEAEQVSIFLLSYNSEEEAKNALLRIEASGYLTEWNTVRSTPIEEGAEQTAAATELLWRTRESLVSNFGEGVADAAFTLRVNSNSEVLTRQIDAETFNYMIIRVSGREKRKLSDAEFRNKKFELMINIIDERVAADAERSEFWRQRIPTQPVLDPKFLVPPTPAPGQAPQGGGNSPAPGG